MSRTDSESNIDGVLLGEWFYSGVGRASGQWSAKNEHMEH